jgi:hypothetical protein
MEHLRMLAQRRGSNVGVLVGAGLVAATGSARPDLTVDGAVAAIFLRSAWRGLAEAIPARRCGVPQRGQARDICITNLRLGARNRDGRTARGDPGQNARLQMSDGGMIAGYRTSRFVA